MRVKIIILFSMCLTACAQSFAQVRTDISVREHNNSSVSSADFDYNAHDYSVGFAIGSSKMYGDLPYSNPQPVYIGDFNKNFGPRFSTGFEVQIGDLSSRDPYTHMRSFNHFTAFDYHLTCEIGTLFSLFDKSYEDNTMLYYLSGLYGGVGIGVINNDVKRIADINVDALPGYLHTSNPPILTNSTAIYIPFNVGYNLHVQNFWKFRGGMFFANFQYNDCMSDYIDGYKLAFKANKKNDVFTVFSIGFRAYIRNSGTARVELEY